MGDAVCRVARRYYKPAGLNLRDLVGLQHIQAIRQRLHPFLNRVRRHVGVLARNLQQVAYLVRRKMRHQHKGHPGIGRKDGQNVP